MARAAHPASLGISLLLLRMHSRHAPCLWRTPSSPRTTWLTSSPGCAVPVPPSLTLPHARPALLPRCCFCVSLLTDPPLLTPCHTGCHAGRACFTHARPQTRAGGALQQGVGSCFQAGCWALSSAAGCLCKSSPSPHCRSGPSRCSWARRHACSVCIMRSTCVSARPVAVHTDHLTLIICLQITPPLPGNGGGSTGPDTPPRGGQAHPHLPAQLACQLGGMWEEAWKSLWRVRPTTHSLDQFKTSCAHCVTHTPLPTAQRKRTLPFSPLLMVYLRGPLLERTPGCRRCVSCWAAAYRCALPRKICRDAVR